MQSRSLDRMIEDQVRRWEAARRGRPPECRHEPVIALSRLPGCGGRELAQELARRLKLDVFDKEILHRVAESSRLSEAILGTVDDKVLSAAEEWIESLLMERYLSEDYLRHLFKVILAIAAHGRAIILGRGAGFILRPECCLRVLLVAPLEDRIRAVAARDQVSRIEAGHAIAHTEKDRRDFIRKHFHAEMTDPARYDISLNTAGLNRESVLGLIQAAWECKRANVPALRR